MDRVISPAGSIHGRLVPPGDKSISHRALIFGAMTQGASEIAHLAPGGDVASTASCLQTLGADLKIRDGSARVDGKAWSVSDRADLDAANSGTTMRLLAGALAGRRGRFVLRGDASLSRRPMDRIAVPLRKMGASVELEGERFPPIRIAGASLRGISYPSPVASAQVKGAILLAGLQAEGKTRVQEPGSSRDHTERFLAWLGVGISHGEGWVEIADSTTRLPLEPFALEVPGDVSSAAYPIVAACLLPGSELVVEAVGVNPTRTGFIDVLRAMGAAIEVEVEQDHPEPAGRLSVRSTELHGTTVEGDLVPRALDELPLVAVAATQADGETVVRGAEELRVKEADRIGALARGLRAMGAGIEELPDGFVVTGPTRLVGGAVDPEGDHRLALSFAVAGLVSSDPVVIADWEVSAISYPGFEADLGDLVS